MKNSVRLCVIVLHKDSQRKHRDLQRNILNDMKNNLLKVALAQISPVWLNKEKTIEKIEKSIVDAAKENCELIVFGEALFKTRCY